MAALGYVGYGTTNVGTKKKPIMVQEGASATDIANAKNAAREQEVRDLIDEVIGVYSPGGSFGKGTEAMLERQKTKDVASGTQSLISSGLYGSTMTAGLPKKWEEEIGMPQRAKLEDIRSQAYTGALGQKASFIQSIEDTSPSFELMAGLTQQASAAPQQSLSDWLSANFGGGSSSSVSTTKKTESGQSLADMQKIKLKNQAYTPPNITFDMSGLYGSLNTEKEREERKKAGYYLNSSGNLVKL